MYNTQTNVISSVPDLNIILKVLSDYSKGKTLDEIKDNMIVGNVYGIRTKGSRVRFYTAINSTFLQFKTQSLRDIINERNSKKTGGFMIWLPNPINILKNIFQKLKVFIFLLLNSKIAKHIMK